MRPPKLWEAVLERLRDAILSGELRPGTKLIETDLAEDREIVVRYRVNS